MKLSLAVIVKDEVSNVNRIIADYSKYFDEMIFAVDDDKALAELSKNTNAKFYKYDWGEEEKKCGLLDFARKRNFAASKVTGDYYVRIDTDDSISNPEKLREVAEYADKNKISVVVCYYLYSKDDNGNTNAAHYRETIIKNSQNLKWNKSIHENVIPQSLTGYKLHVDDTIRIDHHIDYEHSVNSIVRNLAYLIHEYNRDREKTDPRTLAYLGRTFFSLKNFDKAIFFLQKHIEKSGWDDDRYVSWSYLSEVFNQRNDFAQAIACANEALQERPEYPDAYFKLHDIYWAMKKWDKAVIWGEMGFSKKQPKSFMVLDPSSWTWRPALSMAHCLSQLDRWEEANKYFNYAKKLAPEVAWVKENAKFFEEGLRLKKFNENFLKVYAEVKKHSVEDAGKLVFALPPEMRKSELLMGLERTHAVPKEWDDDEICFLCPTSAEPWSPKSIEKGIGGSEEAVIWLTSELKKLGFKITVYADVSEEGDYNGIEWLDWRKFNPNDKFSHLVGWRVNIGGYKFRAKNKIIWLHDIPNCLVGISDDEVKGIDKVVVLSNYHKSLLPKNIPDDKIIVSTNGINASDFVGLGNIKREKNRIIWASSYDRGLDVLLKDWKKIKSAVPDATLHIFYGWNTYDALADQGLRTNNFKPYMTKLMQQEGVFEHGRIGHKELLKEYSKSAIMAYPCNYAGEINCIALTKAVACGVMVVSNDYAVMKERNPHIVVTDDEFIDTVIDALKGNIKVHMDTKRYINENSWEAVAKDWSERVFKTPLPVVLTDRHSWIRKQCPLDKKIVDIGCNQGHMFEGLDRTNITSVDIDDYPLPNFVRANAEKLPFEDKKFDIALLAEIVEHCPNPINALSEACRVAKKVVVTVPWEHRWTSALRPFTPIEKEMENEGKTAIELAQAGNPKAKDFYTEDGLRHLYHETFYDPKLLSEHLAKAGFTKVDMKEIRFDEWVWLACICE